MIDLHRLHIFHTVAHEGSFSAAAERLFITQSAVSQHIKELEASLGQTLFERGWRGVSLTSSGEVLADYARQVFALIAEAETALTNVQALASGKVSIGATPGVGVYLAPLWVQQFRARYPKLTVSLSTGITSQIAADVLAHRIDLGVVEGELDEPLPARLAYIVLDRVEQQVVVGFKHPLWNESRVRVDDLSKFSFITRQPHSQSRVWLERTLKRHGIEPTVGAEFDNLESIKRAVAVGMCVAVLPPYVVQHELEQNLLHAIPVEGSPFVRELKLIWDRELRFTPITRAFVDYLNTQYPNSLRTLHEEV
ncbi:MAG: LysR family transcriptional regulator [Anaerolinea sp.]|nr:LysR family transcriptional regulator [Anaerolinea sp.]